MASSSTQEQQQQPLQEWLVIIPDHKGALEKRIAARPQHVEGLKSDREDMWLWGGEFRSLSSCLSLPLFSSLLSLSARSFHSLTRSQQGAMLEEPYSATESSGPPKMKGSACLVGAATREEVIERVKQDIYVKSGVWNLEEMQIVPFRSVIRKAL